MPISQHIAPTLPALVRSIDGTDYTLDMTTTPDATILYLLQYGYSQALGDTQAVANAAMVKAAVKAGVLPDGTTDVPKDHPAYDAFVANTLATRAKARLDALIGGKMVFGETERLTPEERDRRDITMAILKTAVTAAGARLPPDKDNLQALLDAVYEQRKAEIDRDVAARAKARAKHASGVDLSGLAGLLKKK
jgi:hypothetical protein